MRTINRFLYTAIAIIVSFAVFSSCGKNAEEQCSEVLRYKSYLDIPGVTDDEINAIEALRKQRNLFVYAMTPSGEAFLDKNGEIRGYAAMLCEWLTELFGITFKAEYFAWGELIAGLETGKVDFTGEMTATNERRKTYFMTDAIARREIKYFRLTDSEPLSAITEYRPLRYLFLKDTTTFNSVSALADEKFDPVFIDDGALAYAMLKSGEVDVYFNEGPEEYAFDGHSDVVTKTFFPLIYSPVSLSTQNPELAPIISIVQKALENGVLCYLTELYNIGHQEYLRHKLYMQLTEKELAYLNKYPVVHLAAEYDNYPISFYDTHTHQWQGIAFDVLNRVEKLTGLSFEIINDQNTEWHTLFKLLENGKAAIVTELIRSEEREGHFLWPNAVIFTDYYALISKSDFRDININEIMYLKIGLEKDTAYAESFHSWFPNHTNTVEYENIYIAFSALERGEVDLVMASQNHLLILTNYRELAGYKANVIFDHSFKSTFGFNKDYAVLCSIIDKTLNLIDTKRIVGQWTRKTYDYTARLAQAQRPWLIGVSVLALCLLCLLIYIFLLKQYEKIRLKDLVRKRTAELEGANRETIRNKEMLALLNEVSTLLLTTESDRFEAALTKSMKKIAEHLDIDRAYIWRVNHRNEESIYTQLYEWLSPNTDSTKTLKAVFGTNWIPRVPEWEYLFEKREYILEVAGTFTGSVREQFYACGIKAIMAFPVYLQDQYWGFVSFDNCHNEKLCSEQEASILQSGSLLFANAIERNEITLNMCNTLTKLETIINHYKGIIWSVNSDGVITTFNGQYLKTTNITSDFLEGKKLEVARLKNRHLDMIENVEKTFRDGPQSWQSDIDGTIFRSNTVPLYDTKGKITGVVGSTDDVTDMIMLQRDLEAAAEGAEAANRAKSIFLATMSHEIRTPMNAIIGMTTIGISATDIERMKYCFNKIHDASNHLLGVINDILDMSKIEAGRFDLAPTEFNFEKMLRQVVNVINFRVDEKQQKFSVHIDNTIPKTLVGDDQRLAQVITNLLSNAVKFTPEQGSISLDTCFLKDENSVCTILFTVTDTGIGITPEQQARLFKSFQQAEDSTARRFGGTGLGLSISKSIVELMGGEIWLESKFGKGSTFSFKIQAQRGADKDKTQGSLASDINPGNVSILLVDDDPNTLLFFKEIIHELGMHCDAARSGDDALILVKEKGPYDIYFIDWKMSDIDGIELTKILNENVSTSGKTVLTAISAAQWSTVEDEAKKAGIDKFLSKPLFPSAITDVIYECLDTDQGHTDETQPSGTDDLAGHYILLAEDLEINREIVLALLESTQLVIDCAENGAEAVRMFSEAPSKYDMIFMDVQMPEMDGYEATRRIRSLKIPQANTIPIIAMTANVFREDVQKCLEAGMNDHIGKPLNVDEIHWHLQWHILRKKSNFDRRKRDRRRQGLDRRQTEDRRNEQDRRKRSDRRNDENKNDET